jgi:hypothetical protein
MRAERGDYRIIARARAADRSSMRVTARIAQPITTRTHERAMRARGAVRVRSLILAAAIYSRLLRGERQHERTEVIVLAEAAQPGQPMPKAARSVAARVSNRNGANARRNRIFLHRRHHIFVVATLQTRADSLETRCESSDSPLLIRLEVRRPVAF